MICRAAAPERLQHSLTGRSSVPSGSARRRLIGVAVCVTAITLACSAPRLLAASPESGKPEADALLERGRALYRGEEFLEARVPLEQAVGIYHRLGAHEAEAETLLWLGDLSVDLGQYDRAADRYGEALAIWRRLGSRRREAGTLRKLGTLANVLAQYGNARELYQQALAIWKELGLEWEQAETLRSLRIVVYVAGQYDASVGYLEQSLAIWRGLGDGQREVSTLLTLGVNANGRGLRRKAREYYGDALALSRKLGLKEEEARSLRLMSDDPGGWRKTIWWARPWLLIALPVERGRRPRLCS